jgi:hypothetical protein
MAMGFASFRQSFPQGFAMFSTGKIFCIAKFLQFSSSDLFSNRRPAHTIARRFQPHPACNPFVIKTLSTY